MQQRMNQRVNGGSFWEPYEAYQPHPSGKGYNVAWVYSPIKDAEQMLRQYGWEGEIKYRPMTEDIREKHNWDDDTDPEGPWAGTMGFAEEL